MRNGRLRNWLYLFARAIPWRLAGPRGGPPLFIPFYHAVTDLEPPHLRHLYPLCSTRRFENDLRFLLRHFRPASWEQVQNYASGKPLPAGAPFFFLTFDDGLQETEAVIAPLLQRYGLPAVFFVNPAFIGNRQLFYRYKVSLLLDALGQEKTRKRAAVTNAPTAEELERKIREITWRNTALADQLAGQLQVDFHGYLTTRKPYLTTEQITELHGRGFLIGSHSYDHPHFSQLSLPEMRQQVEKSFNCLEALGIRERIFAFPFSDDQVPAAFIRSLHADFGVSVSFGTAGLKREAFPFHLQRIAMEEAPGSGARDLLKFAWLAYRFRKWTGGNLIRRP